MVILKFIEFSVLWFTFNIFYKEINNIYKRLSSNMNKKHVVHKYGTDIKLYIFYIISNIFSVMVVLLMKNTLYIFTYCYDI